MKIISFLLSFVLIFFLQFPAISCPLPELNVIPHQPEECVDNPNDETGCTPVTVLGIVGSWRECSRRSSSLVFRVWYAQEHYFDYGYISFSHYHVYYHDFYDGQGLDEDSYSLDGFNYWGYYSNRLPPQIDTFTNPEMECWCPPPPCLFPQCVLDQVGKAFPFDIFLSVSEVPLTCPSVEFFGFYYDLCFIYEALRFIKYPIAAGLIIKIVMAL